MARKEKWLETIMSDIFLCHGFSEKRYVQKLASLAAFLMNCGRQEYKQLTCEIFFRMTYVHIEVINSKTEYCGSYVAYHKNAMDSLLQLQHCSISKY